MKNTFTDADVDTLVMLWERGETAKNIAIIMERPFANIRNKIKALQKKGLLRPRERTVSVPTEDLLHFAGMYSLPIDLVEHFASLYGNNKDRILAGVAACCEAYVNQNGYCYYLDHRVKLTTDDSPSSMVPMQGKDGEPILCCKAVAMIRHNVSHHAFINICKFIASRFGGTNA